jgi:hypothetical protein
MGLFSVFKPKKKEIKKQSYEVGQVGKNPNQKLIAEGNNLFIEEKGLFGKKKVPINPPETKNFLEKKEEI